MPDLTLSVTAAQKTRIDAAFGDLYPDETLNGAFYSNWVKRQIRAVVQKYEERQRNTDAAIAADLNTEGWDD